MTDLDLQPVFLSRQPILDRNQQLFAYELLFRNASAEKGNFARFSDGNQATATVIINTFMELSLADALGPYQGFIKVDQGLLFSDLIDALPAHAVVLEILDSVPKTPEVIARCEQLRQADYVLATRALPTAVAIGDKQLLNLAQFIKVDISHAKPDELKLAAEILKPLRKIRIAEKVESLAEMQLCHELGFDLFQGYYFARPAVIQGKRLQSSEQAVLRLLGLISQEADTAEIEAVFKREPVLTINLLRLTNSAGSGLTTHISSLRHAITLLGHRQLLRWLQLLLYSGASSQTPVANPLLQLAATRGRLMELLADYTPDAKTHGRDFIDQAFMVGILSLMPALLGVNAGEVLAQLPLVAPVHEALNERRGVLGDLLTLVESMDDDMGTQTQTADALQQLPSIDIAGANSCLTRALSWANNLAR